jgi:hypothetical protein
MVTATVFGLGKFGLGKFGLGKFGLGKFGLGGASCLGRLPAMLTEPGAAKPSLFPRGRFSWHPSG